MISKAAVKEMIDSIKSLEENLEQIRERSKELIEGDLEDSKVNGG